MIIKCFCKLIISAYRTDFSLVKADILSWNQWSYDNLLQLQVWPIGFWNSSRIGGRKHKFISKKDWERQWTTLTFTSQVTDQRAQPRIRQWGRTCALCLVYLYFLIGVEEELANQDQICYVGMQLLQQIRSYIGTMSRITSALMMLATDIKFITQSNSKTHFIKLRISVLQNLVITSS